MEKKPNANAETAEKPSANKFLNFNWRITETTESSATTNKILASMICCM